MSERIVWYQRLSYILSPLTVLLPDCFFDPTSPPSLPPPSPPGVFSSVQLKFSSTVKKWNRIMGHGGNIDIDSTYVSVPLGGGG